MPTVSLPLFDQPEVVPYQGRTAIARAASFSGAVHALPTRRGKLATYDQLIRNHGPMTDHEAAGLLMWALSSVNSVRGMANKRDREAGRPERYVPRGVEVVHWEGAHFTERTQWGIRR